MKIRLMQDWRQWREGDELELGAGPAMALIERKTAVRAEEYRMAEASQEAREVPGNKRKVRGT